MLTALATGLSFLDLKFQSTPRIIATVVLESPGGVALIDPGPTSTLPTLRRGLADAGVSISEVTALLLTHIHLDHAGATGTLLRENPALRVYVHEKGAPHLVDPGKLLASASRLYGDAMDRLWGEVLPVPRAALVVLKGGEQIEEGGRVLDVAYTPGHASHHVSFFNAEARVAFVGDTAGVRLIPGGYVLAPTPPPDIDLEVWRESLGRILAWRPDTLFLTHFGPHQPIGPHVMELNDHLESTRKLVERSLSTSDSDEARETWFANEMRQELRRGAGEEEAGACEVAAPFDLNWRGLARYLRKRESTKPVRLGA